MGTLFGKGETSTPPRYHHEPASRLDISTLTSLPITIAGQLTSGMPPGLRVSMDSAALDDLALF